MNARIWINNQADLTIVTMQPYIDINKELASIKTRRNTSYVFRSAASLLFKSFVISDLVSISLLFCLLCLAFCIS